MEKRRRKSKNYEIDMVNGPILIKLIKFSIPLMLSGVLQLLFNAADIIVVGRFSGEASLAAVGSTASLINLLTNLFIGLSIGANVVVARYYGSRNRKMLSRAVHTALMLSVVSGIFLTLIGVVFTENILVLMQTPHDVLPLAALYLRIYFLGMCPMMIYNFGSAIMRAVGDTRRPLYYLSVSGVVNIIINLVLVIIFDMNVAGVGIATVIAQTVAAILTLRCLHKERSGIRLRFRLLRFDKGILIAIMRVGLPAGLTGTVFSISNVIIQSAVNSFGSVVVAGNSAANSIEGFIYMAMNAYQQAAISFSSQNMGAGKTERITPIAIRCNGCVIVVGLVMSIGAYLMADPLLGIYSSSAEVIAIGRTRLGIVGITYVLCGMMDVFVGMMRGMGYSLMPMIVAFAGVCGIRIMWIFTLFAIPEYHTIEVLYMSYPVSWLITTAIHFWCFMYVRRRMLGRIRVKK